MPLLAQVLSVVDVYDALTTDRPYKRAVGTDDALRELRAEARQGWKFDWLVEEFAPIAVRKHFEHFVPTDPFTEPPLRRRRSN